LTFRLVNNGLREVWHDSVFLYHTWHPGSDGVANYIGPSDGRHMSTTALATRETGRVMPLVENAPVRALREGRTVSTEPLIDPGYQELWTEEAISQSPNFTLFQQGQAATKLILSLAQHNVLEYGGHFYGVPHALGPVDLAKIEDRTLPGIVTGATAEDVQDLLPKADAPAVPAETDTKYTRDDGVTAPVSTDIKTARAVETANGSVETSAEHAVLGAFDDEFAVDSLLAALQGSSSEASVGAIGNDVLKLTVRNEVSRRLRHQRIAHVEEEMQAETRPSTTSEVPCQRRTARSPICKGG
jgi:hypothetical protein